MHRDINRRQIATKKEHGGTHGFAIIVFLIALFAIIGSYHSVVSHVSGDIPDIKSGIAGDCLDDRNSDDTPGAAVDIYGCNDTDAQAWTVNMDTIQHESLCLSVEANGKAAGDKVDLNTCDNQPGQIWLRDKTAFYNPNSEQCLNAPSSDGGTQLAIAPCNDPNTPSVSWSTNQPVQDCANVAGQGNQVACTAIKEWTTWQSGSINHNTLLNQYTDGAPYEEWCADFVSYVYKEAGYPFANGEADGWDESNANNVQYQGFTYHDPSNYTPKPGDVAYFNYEGGHVEIVISGGKTPTFIYGNSATIDPSTGNGQMASNTITNDGSLGHLVYYLSPN